MSGVQENRQMLCDFGSGFAWGLRLPEQSLFRAPIFAGVYTMLDRSVLSSISRLIHFAPGSRRRKNRTSANFRSCDVLEFRRMLSAANTAPQLENVVLLDGTIEALVVDPGYYGLITINADVDGDSTPELVTSAVTGDEIYLDLSYSIPPNTTATVVVNLIETPSTVVSESGLSSPPGELISGEPVGSSGGRAGESSTYTFNVAGIVLEEVEITSVFILDGVVYGAINPGDLNPNATAEVMWRVVGDTSWSSGGSIDTFGNFSFSASGGEGVTYEFVVVQRYGQFDVYGEVASASSSGASSSASQTASGSSESDFQSGFESDFAYAEMTSSNEVYYDSYTDEDDEDEFWELYA